MNEQSEQTSKEQLLQYSCRLRFLPFAGIIESSNKEITRFTGYNKGFYKHLPKGIANCIGQAGCSDILFLLEIFYLSIHWACRVRISNVSLTLPGTCDTQICVLVTDVTGRHLPVKSVGELRSSLTSCLWGGVSM